MIKFVLVLCNGTLQANMSVSPSINLSRGSRQSYLYFQYCCCYCFFLPIRKKISTYLLLGKDTMIIQALLVCLMVGKKMRKLKDCQILRNQDILAQFTQQLSTFEPNPLVFFSPPLVNPLYLCYSTQEHKLGAPVNSSVTFLK